MKDNLGDGERKKLSSREIDFWNEMIAKYLKPLDKDPEKEKQVGDNLSIDQSINPPTNQSIKEQIFGLRGIK